MKRLFLFLFSALLIGILSSVSFACSMTYFPNSKFNPKAFMFLGEVVGYSDKIPSKKVSNDIYAVRVKVLEKFFLYKESKDFFEVAPFGKGADCSTVGYKLEDLKEEYPIGSKVKVLAVQGNLIPNKNKAGQIILEVDGLYQINRIDSNKESISSTTSVFDYSKWKESSLWQINFELQKDIFRLEKATIEKEKLEILERIIYFDEFVPEIPLYRIQFEMIAKTYLKNSPNLQTLLEKRRKIELESKKF